MVVDSTVNKFTSNSVEICLFFFYFCFFPACDVAEHRMVLAVMLTGGDVMNFFKKKKSFLLESFSFRII